MVSIKIIIIIIIQTVKGKIINCSVSMPHGLMILDLLPHGHIYAMFHISWTKVLIYDRFN